MGTTADKLQNIINVKNELADIGYIGSNVPFSEYYNFLKQASRIDVGGIDNNLDFSANGDFYVSVDNYYKFDFTTEAINNTTAVKKVSKDVTQNYSDFVRKAEGLVNTKRLLGGILNTYIDNLPFSQYPKYIPETDSAVLGFIDADKKFQGVAFYGTNGTPKKTPIEIENFYTYKMTDVRYDNPLTLTVIEGTPGIRLNKFGTTLRSAIRYRINDGDWQAYTMGEHISLNNGDKVSFCRRIYGDTTSNSYDYFGQEGEGKFAASGNIMSMLDFANECIPYCFQHMFDGASLTTAPELPATTLAEGCYEQMFSHCSNLTIAPELPATTLAKDCYQSMFSHCSNLTKAPKLPATVLAEDCYAYMFTYCSNLTIAPELPATTLAKDCYQSMFSYCPNLTKAPKLPATTLVEGCYSSMFGNCKSLTTAPELPATTLVKDCYQSMFSGCDNLASIRVNFSSWELDKNSTNLWVYCFSGMNTNGTFYKPSALPTEYGESRIPEGWTVINID
jgi:hypothetical protein